MDSADRRGYLPRTVGAQFEAPHGSNAVLHEIQANAAVWQKQLPAARSADWRRFRQCCFGMDGTWQGGGIYFVALVTPKPPFLPSPQMIQRDLQFKHHEPPLRLMLSPGTATSRIISHSSPNGQNVVVRCCRRQNIDMTIRFRSCACRWVSASAASFAVTVTHARTCWHIYRICR
jgi:hypothetical protein